MSATQRWMHVAVTRQGRRTRVYVDGVALERAGTLATEDWTDAMVYWLRWWLLALVVVAPSFLIVSYLSYRRSTR